MIGFSTHEEPDNMAAIQIAYAKGARIFERHIGVPTKTISLNAYSSTPEQIDRWIEAWKVARDAEGPATWESDPKEDADLASLKRGVFAKKPLKKGQALKRSDVAEALYLDAKTEWRAMATGMSATATDQFVAQNTVSAKKALLMAETKLKNYQDLLNVLVTSNNNFKMAIKLMELEIQNLNLQ
jgi:N-acetylneuraminate synthase